MCSKTARLSLSREQLLERSKLLNEGVLHNGIITVETGHRTGRSPKERFIVHYPSLDIAWGGTSQPIEKEIFVNLWQRAVNYLEDKEHFVNHLAVGSHAKHFFPVKVITEYAWHALFALNMFVSQPECDPKSEWQLINVPGMMLDPKLDGTNSDGAVLLDFVERKVLLCGMRYAGEMKKAMFTALNYHLPSVDVLPMHCAANVGVKGNSALFFGLSGTGKTTLSADPKRKLIGDDEHGWSVDKVFNFEGGCYAKCINLTREKEPVIWDAIKSGAVLENVVLNKDGNPDFFDSSKTENTRASYPLSHIKFREVSGQAGAPTAVIFLACDLFGVLPAISILTPEQAAYYFLSGYTAKVGSTEFGAKSGVNPTFSACFGAPFFTRPTNIYADLLMKRLAETNAKVYLVNTGWHGGSYGDGGSRYPIHITRAIVEAATEGLIDANKVDVLQGFELAIPLKIEGVADDFLNPRTLWKDQDLYTQKSNELVKLFKENSKNIVASDAVKAAGPNFME